MTTPGKGPVAHVAAFGLGLLLLTSTARAAWLEASSDHFVIYGDQPEKTLAGFAERLELYHAAMSHVLGREQERPSPSNRLTVFVVPTRGRVRELAGGNIQNLAGVYRPRAGSAIAVVPKLKQGASDYELDGETILFHEYAHHLMYSLTPRTYPRWFVEGFAEFFAGVTFKSDGSVGFGVPPMHRAAELAYAPEVPIRRLLDFDGGVRDRKQGFDSFYGQSWLLFHYLQFAPERAGQLARYQQQLASGVPALVAAQNAFGDLRRLEKDLDLYANRRKLSIMVVDRGHLNTGSIVVRPLRPGEAAIMPVVMRSKAGVTLEQALGLLPEARQVAGQHPQDAAVLAALAEAEFDADNDDAAIAAADRALAIDPGQINAQLQKGYALYRKAQAGALPPAAWKDVRSQFLRANRIEPDHPVPLVRFYLSFLEQGEPVTRNAVSGLERAMQVAPFDPSLRWLVAQQMISDERLSEASQTLAPLAYSPHPGEHTEAALRLLEEVEGRLGGSATATVDTARAD